MLLILSFNSKGSQLFGEMTSQYVGQSSYIIYNNEILSAKKSGQLLQGDRLKLTDRRVLGS